MAEQLQLNTLVLDASRLSMNLVQVRQNILQVVGEAPKVEGFADVLEKSKLADLEVGSLLKGEGLAAPFVSGIKAALAFEQHMRDLELGPQQADPLQHTGLKREQAAAMLPQAGVLQSKENLEQLQGAIAGVTLAFGLALLPAFNTLAQAVTPLLQGLAKLIVLHPGLVEGAGAAAAAFTVMRIAATTAMLALNATPIGLLVGAIALFAGIIVANWEWISSTTREVWSGLGEWFSGLWDSIQVGARAGWEKLKEIISWHPLLLLINNWERIPEIIGKVASLAGDLLAAGWAQLREELGWSPLPSLDQAWASAGQVFDGAIAAVVQKGEQFGGAIKGVVDSVSSVSFNLGWDDISGAFDSLWQMLDAAKARFDSWGATLFDSNPLPTLEKVWGGVLGWFQAWWEQLAPFIESARALLNGDFSAVVKGVIETASNWGKPAEEPEQAAPAAAGEPAEPLAAHTLDTASPLATPASHSLVQQTAEAQRASVEGSVLVRFENAPPGLSVVATQSNHPGLSIRSNVGVRSLSQGGVA
ncbi:hypothetical protein [Pseudomonas fontis]|uniref:Phage tail tape measure protein n=1 Tax=Pseudomonas fontis TaxID=2942633 RepID=A0ABT5NPP1_9PSED|nr:hypothetical protein [Pseudomonas fontis]MDD0972439.1 hypothetical protein [Pseudomonas fontis]MDD0990104.1 hypothetical protein [Pseudomonas fontis]